MALALAMATRRRRDMEDRWGVAVGQIETIK